MGESILANLLSWPLIVFIVLMLAFFRSLFARVWVELWAAIYPEAGDALRCQYADEVEIDDRLRALGRALLFAVSVPQIARRTAVAEREPKTRTTTQFPATTKSIETDPVVPVFVGAIIEATGFWEFPDADSATAKEQATVATADPPWLHSRRLGSVPAEYGYSYPQLRRQFSSAMWAALADDATPPTNEAEPPSS